MLKINASNTLEITISLCSSSKFDLSHYNHRILIRVGGQEGEGKMAIKTYRESGEEKEEEKKDNLAIGHAGLFTRAIFFIAQEWEAGIFSKVRGSQGSKRLGNGHPIRIQMSRETSPVEHSQQLEPFHTWNTEEHLLQGLLQYCQKKTEGKSSNFPPKLIAGAEQKLRVSPQPRVSL